MYVDIVISNAFDLNTIFFSFLGNRGMTVEAARQCAKDRKEWRALVHMSLNEFHAAIFVWHCVLSDRPPVLWWLSPGEGRGVVT